MCPGVERNQTQTTNNALRRIHRKLEKKLDMNSDIVHVLLTLFWISRTFDGPLSAEEEARQIQKCVKMNNIRFLTFWLACPASKMSAWMSSSKLDVGLKVAKKFKKTWLLYNWGCCEADSSKSRHCLRRYSSSVFLKRLWRPMLGRCPDKCRLLWIRWRFWWSFLKSERLFWVTSLVLASGIPSG